MRLSITPPRHPPVTQPFGDSPRKITPLMPTVRRGETGETVVTLQQWLNHYGASIAVDGIFGEHTEFALRTFQYQMFLPTSGAAGPHTWDALILGMPVGLPRLHLGARSAEVSWVQEILANLGLYRQPVDGLYGLHTQTAVRRYQVSRHLALADGIVGEATWAALSQDRLAANHWDRG